MVEIVCEWCGEKSIKVRKRRFCSHKCSNIYKWTIRERGDREVITCKSCGEDFSLLKSHIKVREKSAYPRYCSQKCMGIGNKKDGTFTTLKCSYCDNEFSKRTDHVFKNNYCSLECRDKGRRKISIWSEHTPDMDARREYFRKYVDANRALLNRRSTEWGKRNQASKSYNRQMRRASGSITKQQFKELFDNNKKCNYCGSTENLQVDHIHPVSKGGKTELSNLQVLCRSCNASKGNKVIPQK
jgi:5-methylcytosine-specific restriction endonuclease McrA